MAISCNPQSLLNAAIVLWSIENARHEYVGVYLLCQWANAGTSDAADQWAQRVVTNGGAAPAASTVSAVRIFLTDIASIQSKIKTLNVIAPDSVTAALTPLIKTYGTDPWVLRGGGVGTLTVNGYANRVIDTGIAPASIPSWSNINSGMTTYGTEVETDTTNVSMGCIGATDPPRMLAYIGYSIAPRALLAYINDAANAINWQPGGGVQSGYYSINRDGLAAANLRVFFARSDVAHSQAATASGGNNTSVPPASTFCFVGVNTNNTTYTSTPRRFSFCALHDALTLAESAILYAAVQKIRQSFGGGFA